MSTIWTSIELFIKCTCSFTSLAKTCQGTDNILVSNRNLVPIENIGHGLLPTPTRKLNLHNLLHVPAISHNLLFISNLKVDNNCSNFFDALGYQIKDLLIHQTILQGSGHNGLYPLLNHSSNTFQPFALSIKIT